MRIEPLDNEPLTRRQLEIVIACVRGQIDAAGHIGEPWADRILARLRARYVRAPFDDVDELDCPRVEAVLPFPVPLVRSPAPEDPRPTTRKVTRGKGRSTQDR